jgi:hypothetical protein
MNVLQLSLKQIRKIGLFLVLPSLLVAFVLLTDPYKLPLVFLVVPFVLFAATVYQFSHAGLRALGVSRRRARLIGIIVTSLLLLLALLQSIHQLSLKDFLILTALLIGLTLYLRRLDI